MSTSRRHDRLGVHSIGEFHMTVPSLDDAERFYRAFGLDVRRDGDGLALRTTGGEHVWGRLSQGPKKKFDRLSLNCFEDELDRLRAHVVSKGVALVPAPAGASGGGFWLRDPDGVLVQVRPGPKTTLDAAERQAPQMPVDGIRTAPCNSAAKAALPTRLSHIARLTAAIDTQIDFYTSVLGLRLADRSGGVIAFLHAPHGSDHHMLAFVGGAGAALHHLSWDVPSVDDIGLNMMRLQMAGYTQGWGLGRHVLGSNYFYYARDPWGSFSELSAMIDYIPATCDWEPQNWPPEDSFFLWGPPPDAALLENSELDA